GLQSGCCDFIHIRNVYHHFENPPAMLADLGRALKPGGLIGIIDFDTDNHLSTSNVPDIRKNHGVEAGTVVEEVKAQGFELVRRVNDWQGRDSRFLLLFRKH
ncbi:MAG TPA: methyltransferase domain-containing protein, partial [Acidobacteriota bacterium]|nr:methyltransferase domain-containing protein [Acidobacteriota bacterium]